MIKVILKIILILQRLSRLLLGPETREEALCRLCLTKRNEPPLLDLLQNASLASLITEVLCLKVSLSRDTSQPHHVCVVCRDTIEKFVDLRNLAVKNEELFIKSSNVNKERIGSKS